MNDTYDTEYCLDTVFRTRQMSLPSHTFFSRLGTVSNNYYKRTTILSRELLVESRIEPFFSARSLSGGETKKKGLISERGEAPACAMS